MCLAALLYITKEQTSWRVAVYNFGCLQRLDALMAVSTVSTVSDHNHADNHADNAHVFLGQKSTVFFAKKFTCMLGAPTTFSLMNSTRSLRPYCAAQCIGVKPFSYLT